MPYRAPTHKPHGKRAPKQSPQGKDNNRQRTRAMHTGSKPWLMQRARVLARDEYTCKACGRFGDQVDHIHDNAHEVVDDDQLQTLCLGCHSAKTMRTINARRHR